MNPAELHAAWQSSAYPRLGISFDAAMASHDTRAALELRTRMQHRARAKAARAAHTYINRSAPQ